MDMKYSVQIIRKYSPVVLLWAMYVQFGKLLRKIRSVLYGLVLNAPGLSIGKQNIIKGIKYITIGRNMFMNDGVWLEAIPNYRGQTFSPSIVIGSNVSFSRNVHIASINQIKIGNDVLMGSNIYVADHNHGSYSGDYQSSPAEAPGLRKINSGGPVIIEDNVWIGDNVVILGPTRIGAGSIVAANSVVKGNVAPLTMIAGVPAKPIKRFSYDLNEWIKI